MATDPDRRTMRLLEAVVRYAPESRICKENNRQEKRQDQISHDECCDRNLCILVQMYQIKKIMQHRLTLCWVNSIVACTLNRINQIMAETAAPECTTRSKFHRYQQLSVEFYTHIHQCDRPVRKCVESKVAN